MCWRFRLQPDASYKQLEHPAVCNHAPQPQLSFCTLISNNFWMFSLHTHFFVFENKTKIWNRADYQWSEYLAFLLTFCAFLSFFFLSLFKKEEVLTNLCSEEVILTVLPFYMRDVSLYVQHLSFLKLNILHHRLLTNLLKSMVDSFTVQQR